MIDAREGRQAMSEACLAARRACAALLTAAFVACTRQAPVTLPAPPPRAIPAALAGHWEGELVQQGQALPIRFDFVSDVAHPDGRFSAARWRVMDYPLSGLQAGGERVSFGLGDAMGLEGVLKGEAIAGTFKGDDGAGTFTLRRAPQAPLPYREIPVTFDDGDVRLSGTLALPEAPGPHEAVVLVHGSGPEVRWGTSRSIADRLARAGIAALVYDKRGTGQSSGDWRKATYEDLARDALAGVATLAQRPEVDPRRIGILGHSEGGIVAPTAATLADDRVAFLIAEDTVVGRIRDQDLFRVTQDVQRQAWSDADKAAALTLYRLFLDVASGDRPYADFEAASATARDLPWSQYLGLPPKDHWLWAWYRSRGNLDTLALWARVRCPVLLVFGERDRIVPVFSSLRRLEDTLDRSGAPYAALVIPRAEHNLTIHPEPGEPFFWWREAPGLVETVIGWIGVTAR